MLLPDVRRVGHDNIQVFFPVKHFREINPEVEVDLVAEALLRCSETLREFAVNLSLQFGLAVVIGFLEEARLQILDVLQPLGLEWETYERISGNNFEVEIWQRLDLLHVFLVHDKRK